MPGGGGGGKGGKGGGGSSGAIDINSTSNSVIDSDSTINANSTSNSTIDAKTTAAIQLVGLDNINVHTDAKSDSKNDLRLAITEPINTNSRMEMDVKPLQAELCLKVGIERLPSTKICSPMERHFGLTLFGQEVLGFNYSEEKKTIVEDLGNRPFVIPTGSAHHSSGHHGNARKHDHGGVRIRLAE